MRPSALGGRPRPFLPLLAIAGFLSLSAGLFGAGTAGAEAPDPPPYYAIENVRVVVGDGTVLDSATVVVADGLIESVGTNVRPPAYAWVIDGSGLTLYPGFVDALSDLGQVVESAGGGPGAGPGGGPPGRGGAGPTIRGPEDRPATTPWVTAASRMGEDARLEKWREGGFAAAVSSPKEGLFSGAAALIHTGGGEPDERVLASPVAQRLNLESDGGFRSFPGSLMGVISYLRQTLSDARHYAAARDLYADDPRGRQRPEYDRTLAPIAEALEAGTPFLMPGVLPREIDRVLAFQEENDIPVVLFGGHGAYDRVAELKASGTPVLVSLDWPEAERDRDPERDEPFRTLAHRRLAPTSPKALADAGVPFAFTSGGLSTTRQIFEGIREAVEAGLTHEQALTALTTGPAKIFGVDDRLGTIEVGKIANLILATDVPWGEDTEIATVFVDGRKYEVREDEGPTEPPSQDVSGTWDLNFDTQWGQWEAKALLTMSEDGRVKGELESRRGDREVERGRMSGDVLRFRTTNTEGGRTREAKYNLVVVGETLEGMMNAGSMTINITGERTSMSTGQDEDRGDRPKVPVEDVRAAWETYQSPAKEMGSFAITGATVYTVSGETLENATVVVADGKIAAVGTDVSIPRGAETIDAQGKSLIPGIIDAHSHIAIEGGVNEGTLAVTSMVGIEDVINPDDIDIYRALAGGVTTAHLLHGSANPIGGKNAVVKLRWGQDAEGMIFEGAPAGIKFALGENPKRSNFRVGTPRYPASRMGVMDVVRQAFADAVAYRAEWQQYEAAKAAGGNPTPPRKDYELEALVEILEGERLVHSHSYRADEILQLLRLAEELGFRVATLQHVLEGYKVADEIAAHGAGASTFSDWWGYKVEAYDAIPYAAPLMAERGVVVSINSDSAEEMRHLNLEAAKMIRWGGMDEIEALKLVTLNPAIQLGIDDRVGSIEVGKDADLVLYDGHPLSATAVVEKTFIDGDLYFDRELDRERQEAVMAVKDRLLNRGGRGGAGDRSGDVAASERPDATRPEGDPPADDPPDGSARRSEIRWQDSHYSCREVH